MPTSEKQLAVRPLPVQARVEGDILAGPSVLSDPDRFVWGGSVIKGEDGKFHMLYNTWECGDSIPRFSDSWVLYSKIAYAISDHPDRDFEFKKIILYPANHHGDSSSWDSQVVSNPHIKYFDGKYYLYYIGGRDPGEQPPGSRGEGVNKRNRVQQSLRIGVIAFENFDDLLNGNFDRPEEPLLSPRTRVKKDHIVDPSPEGTVAKPDNIIVVNPAVVKRPTDGKYLLYFKGNLYDPHWRGVHGVALSDSPVGPFTPMDQIIFDIRLEDGRVASAEDPYVWYSPIHERFFAVMKDFTGKITGGDPGLAMMESPDGINWRKAKETFFMRKELLLTGGDTVKVHRLERPQLLINEKGLPEVLYAACSIVDINPRQDGVSFNVQIPLEVSY